MKKASITNEQLGAVYLKIDGLDTERFKKLTEGMEFYSTVEQELNDGFSYIEYFKKQYSFEWLSTKSVDEGAQLITLDELEERLFTLPEKWCIKITEENKEVLANWRTDGDARGNFVKGVFNGWHLHTPMNGKNGYNTQSKEDGYTEITFGQFKKHVLKQDNNMTTKREQLIKQAKEKYGVVTNIGDSLYQDVVRKHSNKYGFNDFHYEECIDTLYSHPEGEGGLVVYEEGTWAQVKEDIKEQPQTFKVTRQALAEIYEAVCQEWRDTITLLLEKQKFNSDIEVIEDLVKKAHVQSSSAHNPKEVKEWLDKYLPLPKKKKIELVKYIKYNGESAVKWNIGVDPNYKIELILPKEVSSLKYDVMKVKLTDSETWDIFLGHFNDGITED